MAHSWESGGDVFRKCGFESPFYGDPHKEVGTTVWREPHDSHWSSQSAGEASVTYVLFFFDDHLIFKNCVSDPQVNMFRSALALPPSASILQTDSGGLKSLFTLMCRRHDGSTRTVPRMKKWLHNCDVSSLHFFQTSTVNFKWFVLTWNWGP